MKNKTLGYFLSIVFGFSSGVVISGAVYAFIAGVGVVTRIAQKTKTTEYIRYYENVIIVAGLFGAATLWLDFYIPLKSVGAIIFGVSSGIFWGCLAMSLAEVIDVIPILTRRGKVRHGMFYFILSIALGKLFGSIMYYIIPGFYEP